jgi:mannose-1-phosphate guanylyltransferase
MKICSVVLAGGYGTRLWPLSRSARPKQFLKLQSDKTMLQLTLERLTGLDIKSEIVICNESHRFFVAEQLQAINRLDKIILEPEGRNTAPAIALASILKEKDDQILLVLPSDHTIDDNDEFKKIISKALPLAKSGKLVTFGINPNKPATEYGYIKKGEKFEDGYHVKKFVEKPNKDTAKKYVKSGNYLWNSGIFMFKASRYSEELKKLEPEIYNHCKDSLAKSKVDLDFTRIDADSFKKCESISIDYAVMEKTDQSVVVPMSVGWNDLGSWNSYWEISTKDSNGNVIFGDAIVANSKNNLILSESKLVSTVGVDDLVIVSTKDAVMISHMKASQEIKKITDTLIANSRSEWEFHREVYRPWGKYDSIDNGDSYQVKRITVNPGAKLSLQKHKFRSEHWVVVSGTAKVTLDKNIFILNKNESTYIPLGSIHSLENPGKELLELIEVQSGEYLGEDDIERFEDRYGRLE